MNRQRSRAGVSPATLLGGQAGRTALLLLGGQAGRTALHLLGGQAGRTALLLLPDQIARTRQKVVPLVGSGRETVCEPLVSVMDLIVAQFVWPNELICWTSCVRPTVPLMLNDRSVVPRVKVSDGGCAFVEPTSSLKSGTPFPLESFKSSMERIHAR